MTPQEFTDLMQILFDRANVPHGDIETIHEDADKLLCEVLTQLGYGAGVALFRAMNKWYS